MSAEPQTPLRVAFGPEAPAFGSWNWIGVDLCEALTGDCETVCFTNEVPDCDVAVFIKFLPPAPVLRQLRQRTRTVFCPVDIYGSAAEIDANSDALRQCDCVVIHCERLRKYVMPYTRTEYINHHLKYVAPLPLRRKTDGPLVWIGNRANLPPVAECVNSRTFAGKLYILTNLDGPETTPGELGFGAANTVRVENWTERRHIELTSAARAAFDVKGDDFRARHKPPAKALDWIASGVPLAMNADSSSAEHAASLGFSLCHLDETERWLSEAYWNETQQFAKKLQTTLNLKRVAHTWLNLLRDIALSRTC
ncbi:MAG: hypothetical protein DWQ41_12340 [Planctomycetota bacterium]|nr:MAG: hypothetical protein DWQ41_12340 [Planctomycetota bacterium]